MLRKTALYFLLFLKLFCECSDVYYDSYRGRPISDAELKEHVKKNTTFYCVNKIKPCDENEPRRVDGSCNNIEHPTRGATHTPFKRVLPAVYDKDYEARKSKHGDDLPLVRVLRTSLVSVGRIPDQVFTQLTTHFLTFSAGDIVSLQDTVKYILWKPYCCLPRGKTDRDCVPNKVPDDDPVHRFSDVRCLNLTRPESFQSVGCTPNNTVPERIVASTPLLDLSNIYGNTNEALIQRGRKFEGGLLKYEIEEGRIWPPSTKTPVNLCLLNQKPVETRCHDGPENGSNTLLAINIMSIWVWRMHNHIAANLAQVNPCWDDDKLFTVARDINIAIYNQILFYELYPLLMGRNNLLRDGVISSSLGYRDLYNKQVLPQVSLEYPFVLRWFHTMQEGALKMYDTNGYYLREFPIVNLTLRTGFLAVDNNLDYITQGSFRQASGKIDYVIDQDIAEIALGPHQRAADLLTSDLAKNRLFGFQPYVKYREFCFGQAYKTFEDLKHVIDPERLEILKDRYKHVEDIDLLAGIWVERPIKNGQIPQTLYCLVAEQLIRNIKSDRHWYEREKRPHAFTLDQLLEIRKITMARMMCDVADTVSRIQPFAFLRAGPQNEECSCDFIPNINYNIWRDNTCNTHSGDLYY